MIPNSINYPLTVLAALAENPKNRQLDLEWRTKAQYLGFDKYQKYLVVTEGYTNGEVIKKALQILRPNIIDFFDMRDNYPFDGVGNMANFYKGLAKIGTNRKMFSYSTMIPKVVITFPN